MTSQKILKAAILLVAFILIAARPWERKYKAVLEISSSEGKATIEFVTDKNTYDALQPGSYINDNFKTGSLLFNSQSTNIKVKVLRKSESTL